MNNRNPILDTDSYRFSHFKQYPPGTTEVSAYIEARPGAAFDSVTFFGLQMFLKEKLAQRVSQTDVYEAAALVTAHMPGVPFNRAGWDTVVGELSGVLPIEVAALPEGMTVPVGTPGALVKQRDWDDYSIGRADAIAHLGALDVVYAGIVESHRAAIETTEELDKVTQDMLIGQSAQLEQFHWFIRAHLEAADGTLSTAGESSEGAAARSAKENKDR